MKHLVKNNTIISSGIPSSFTRDNGEEFWGGYENMTDLHYEDGWRDEVIPEHDPRTHHLGNPYFDELLDIVTMEVIPTTANLQLEKQRLMSDLIDLRKEISLLITQIRLVYDPEPEELSQMSPMIRSLYQFAKAEIDQLTEENVRQYILRGPQVNQLLEMLTNMAL
jgi:hypothetical protein